MALSFPNIDPVIFSIGSIDLRWYGMAYVAGILLGWFYGARLLKKYQSAFSPQDLDAYILWALAGIVIGGRLGMVLFYAPAYYFADPMKIFMTWKGGMSFHGGALGVTIMTWLFARKKSFSFFEISDLVAAIAPIGLFLGRLANFVNQELYGKITNVPWAVAFPKGGYLPRHPTQLYEAATEGVCLFILVNILWRIPEFRDQPGRITGVALLWYGVVRIAIEPFKELEGYLEVIGLGMTTGQWLSVPMVLIGIYCIFFRTMGQANDSTRAAR